MKYEDIAISQLNPAPYNPRTVNKKEFEGLKASLTKFGFVDPVIANKRNNNIVGGHMRVQAWQQLGNNTVPVIWVDLDDHDERKLNVVLNSQLISGSFDELKLAELLETFKYDDDYGALRLAELEPADGSEGKGSLSERFLMPPFSVLNTQSAAWQERKRHWLSLGIQAELGRGDDLTFKSTGFMADEIERAGGGY